MTHSFDGVSFTRRTSLGSSGYADDNVVILGNIAYLSCDFCTTIETYNLDTGIYDNTFATLPSTGTARVQFHI